MRGRVALIAVLAAAVAALAGPGAAQAVTPSVVNSSNWVMAAAFQGKTDCAASTCATNSNNKIRMMWVVRHDPGVSVTNVIIDKDWDSTNDLDCGCGANTTQTPTITRQTVDGGAIYSHVELEYDFSPHTSGTGMSDGATAVVKNIYSEVNVSSGTDPELSDTVRFFDATNNDGESYPYFYNRSQNDTNTVTPGDSVTYSFRGDDPDGGGPNSGSDWGGYIYRVRRVNSDGSISTVQGDTTVCFGARSDGAAKTLEIDYPNRGYHYVEAYGINSGPGSANGTCHTGNAFASYWFIGDAEVNSGNSTLSGDLSVPAKVTFNSTNAGTAQLTNLDDTDTGGVIQNVEWDANGDSTDGEGGFEEVTLSDAPGTGLTSDSETIDSTGKTEGSTIAVRARITDNGTINGTDPRRAVRTLPTQNTVVNTRPVPAAQTVDVDMDSADNPITLAGSDADSDALTFTTVGVPAHGTLGGSGAARTYTPDPGYAGNDTFTFRANDGQNNSASTATLTIRVRPDTEIFESPAALSNDPDPTFRFRSDATPQPTDTLSFECKLSTEADFSDCDSPKDYTGLPGGSYTFQVRAVLDPGGIADATPASYAWEIDTAAADTDILTAPPLVTNNTTAQFTFESPGEANAAFECKLDGETSFTSCSSGETYDNLANGQHTFSVRSVDPAGNPDPTPDTHIWNVDLVAPGTEITSAPPLLTNGTSGSFGFQRTPAAQGDATYMCKLDAGSFEACGGPAASGTFPFAGLGPGPHTFSVYAIDAAGNPDATPATHTWEIDTTAPQVTITDRPGDPTNLTTADFEFTADEAGDFECSIDGGTFEECDPPSSGTSGTAGYAGLDEDAHSFEVRSTDAAGNTSAAARYDWTVDLTPPFTSITQKPGDPSNEVRPSFEFETGETGSTFECRLDSNLPGDFAACASPYTPPADLGEGTHRFEVRATDPADNLGSAASYQWQVDLTPPNVSADTGPADPTNQTTNAQFGFSADEAGDFECSVDGAAFADCGTGTTATHSAPGPFGEGPHTFEVRSTDAAGNLSAVEQYDWTVDTTPPNAAIDSGPSDPDDQSSATFTFSAPGDPGATFECRLDSSDDLAYEDCTSGKQYTGLSDATHTVDVRATDAAGNVGPPDSHTWTVDTVAPAPSVTAGPPAVTNQPDASLEFTVTGGPAAVQCDLDGGGFTACGSPASYPGLGDGPHTFTVRATDAAGNTGTDTHAWSVDTDVPETAIDSSPPDTTPSPDARFTFSADEPGSAFECRLDSTDPGAWQPCSAFKDYSGLAPGAHTFEVRSTDAAGNTDATPASRTWTVEAAPQGAVLGLGAGSPVIKRRIRALNVPGQGGFQIATISCRARSCKVTRKEARIKIAGQTHTPPVTVEVVAKESVDSLEKGEIAQVVVHFTDDVKRGLAAENYGQLIVKLAAESSTGGATSSKKIRLKAKWLKKLVG